MMRKTYANGARVSTAPHDLPSGGIIARHWVGLNENGQPIGPDDRNENAGDDDGDAPLADLMSFAIGSLAPPERFALERIVQTADIIEVPDDNPYLLVPTTPALLDVLAAVGAEAEDRELEDGDYEPGGDEEPNTGDAEPTQDEEHSWCSRGPNKRRFAVERPRNRMLVHYD